MFPGLPWLPAAALTFTLLGTGCQTDSTTGADADDVESIGSLSGAFSCQVVDDGDREFDLGPAHFAGDIEHTAFVAGLRTQGCYARSVEAERGWVVSVRLIQQTDYDTAQVLELNLPISVDTDDGERILAEGDTVVFSGNSGGFGSMYWLQDPSNGPDPLYLRTAGGVVTVDQPDMGTGDLFGGHFDELRMGEVQ